MIKRNWGFVILLLFLGVIFINRNLDIPIQVAQNPDTQLEFQTEDAVLEQTWQPTVKKIKGIFFPYLSQSDFSSDVKLSIYSDDYSQLLVEEVKENVIFHVDTEGKISFNFPRVRVIPGERYHIQFTLSNASRSGTLLIPSGSNYGGCAIGGKDTNHGASVTIMASKYSKPFFLMAAMFPVLAFSLLFMTSFKKKWEETVALSLFCEGILLYAFGWMGRLTTGICIVYALAIFSLLAAICIYNKKKGSLKELLSPGLWIYFFLFLIIVIVNKNSWPAMRDDLRHWEIVVRDMFFYDSFANHVGTTVLLPRYLPFAGIIEYIFEYMNGMFNKGILLIAYQTMLLSASIIFCRLFAKIEEYKSIFVIAIMICTPVLFFPNIAGSIMVDPLIALVFAYVLICYYSSKNDWFNKIRIISAMVALVLIKEIGLIYAGMAILLILSDVLYLQWREKKFSPKYILFPVISGIIALSAFVSWQMYLSRPMSDPLTEKITKQDEISEVSNAVNEVSVDTKFDEKAEGASQKLDAQPPSIMQASGMSLRGIWNVLCGRGDSYQYEVSRLLLIELFDGKTYSFVLGDFSFMDLLIAFSVIMILMAYWGYWKAGKERISGIAIALFLTSFLLCAFMQLTYWFTFSKYEALDLTSFSRYFAPYLCAVVMLIFYLLYQELGKIPVTNRKARGLVIILTLLLITSMPVENIIRQCKGKKGNATKEVIYGHDNIAGILHSVAKRGERVYFICSASGGLSEYVFRNAACPMLVQHGNWNIVSTDEEVKNAQLKYGANIHNDATVLSVEGWKEILKDYQYVVVFHADEFFQRSYYEMFDQKEGIGDGCVYQVVQNEAGIHLNLIGQSGINEWY